MKAIQLRRMQFPEKGDIVAGVSVALVLIPQSLAYAGLAGLPAVHGLYVAVAAPLAAALIGSSPYLQTGPVALTSLLTLGALTPLALKGSPEFVALAALLAIVVGVVRFVMGVLRLGPISYLMSQPVVTSFTIAASLLIFTSQVPALVDVKATSDNPFIAAAQALSKPGEWDYLAILVGLATIALISFGRRIGPLFPGVLLAAGIALVLSTLGLLHIREVGHIPAGVPPLDISYSWGTLPSLIVPGIVIALVGFAEPASISRRYASEERRPWNPDRELIGQGLANVGAGLFSGYPAGGSFSRSSLNRMSGARTRWSGAITGMVVLGIMPFASVLSHLPKAVLAGLVMSSVLSLLEIRPFIEYWRFSRPQFMVAVLTFSTTLLVAPRVERGVILGVALALGVHIWREMRLHVESWLDGDTLHIRPQGVLYFVSTPFLEERLTALLAKHENVRHVVIHCERLGRADVSGMLVIRSVIQEAESSGIDVTVCGVPPQSIRLVREVIGNTGPADCDRKPAAPEVQKTDTVSLETSPAGGPTT